MSDLLSNKYALHLSYLHLVCHLLQWLWAGGGGSIGEKCGERETGGQAQYDLVLDGGSLKAQPTGFQLDSFKKKTIDGSEQNIYI
jgi:hypothetical protein